MIYPFPKTGYVPKIIGSATEPDIRNWKLESVQPVSPTLPSFYKTDISAIPILMQGQSPACVAHAVTYAVMYFHWKATGTVVRLSPRFLYALCKTVDGLPLDAGTYLETALNIAKNTGICEDTFFPNDPANNQLEVVDITTYANASLISQDAKNNATLYKIPSYAFLTSHDRTAMNNAIYQNSLLIVGQDISSEWWETEGGEVSWSADDLMPIRPADAAHPNTGGHCTVEYAFGEYPHGINSWSNSWGYNGLYWYSAGQQPNIYECAVIGAFTAPAPQKPQETLIQEIEEVVENVVDKFL